MKANVIFTSKHDPRHVLKVVGSGYFVVRSKYHTDIAPADEISGDLILRDVKWLLNITRGTLVDVEVLGRHSTVEDAIKAAAGGIFGSNMV
jgi:hypothetical protein